MMKIRRLEERDLETRLAWMNNPAIYESMHFEVPVTMEKTLEWFRGNLGSKKRADLVVEDNEEIVAFCGITGIDEKILKAETYLFVSPYLHHCGIGTKAKRLMIDYAFNEMGMNKLFVVTNENNDASIALQRKFGYQLEGRFRGEYVLADGTRKDRLYFGLLKKDWEESKNSKNKKKNC